MIRFVLIFAVILSPCLKNNSYAQHPGGLAPNTNDCEINESDRSIRQFTDGDNPLSTTYTWEGFGNADVIAEAFEGIPDISGVFVLTGIPEGSNIIKAFYAITGWQQSNTNASGSFNGNDLGSIQPVDFDEDHTYYLSFYRWDVTTMVNGNDSYSFSGSNLNFGYLAYLVVVYQNEALPAVSITINDGAESLQHSNSTTNFGDLLPGDGIIKIVTQAGDVGDSMGESIEFNGLMLAGPDDVFNSNIGDFADYHEFNLTDVQNENSLTISTGADWIGIHLAVLIGEGFMSDIDELADLPAKNRLIDNYPNPFNASTIINYTLPGPSHVTIEIYDILGRRVETLIEGEQPAGYHQITWDASNHSSGMYFYRIQAGEYAETKKMVLLK
jgi:hypothetical protein